MDMVEQKIRRLKEDAVNRQIYAKGCSIALHLGDQYGKKHGNNWIYFNESLRIKWDDWGPNLTISYNDHDVFYYQIDRIRKYRNDIVGWIPLIEEIYHDQVEPLLTQAIREREQEHERKLQANWGIQ